VDSSSTAVHTWSRGDPWNLAYGWGDQRHIEDWSRVDDATVSSGSIDPVATASIGDLVWNDANGNGQRDAGEAGVGGVVVTVRNGGGSVASTATTAADGSYLVTGLVPGTYAVTIDVPTGYALTTGPVSVTLAAGETVTSADFGVRTTTTPSASPTSTPTSATSTPTASATTTGATVTASASPSPAPSGNLAQTGADGWAFGALGATLALGGLLVLGVRRRR
jgi:LPXTG-motif cell wall-anchored protein